MKWKAIVRPPAWDGSVSVDFSRRSSSCRVVEKAAAARTTMLAVEVEAKRALERLADKC